VNRILPFKKESGLFNDKEPGWRGESEVAGTETGSVRSPRIQIGFLSKQLSCGTRKVSLIKWPNASPIVFLAKASRGEERTFALLKKLPGDSLIHYEGEHFGRFPPDGVLLHNTIRETRLLIFFQRLQPLICLFGDADGFRGHDQLWYVCVFNYCRKQFTGAAVPPDISVRSGLFSRVNH
jgi:hypothetical protein